MKNNFWLICLTGVALFLFGFGGMRAEGDEEEDLSGFALFERLRGMKLEAQAAMVKEDYAEAAKVYRKMARYEKNRARSAAYLLKGADCLMQAKKGHRALEEYTNLLENYPLYVPYEHVVEQLRQLAEWFVVGDGTFLGIRDKDAGIKVYELIIREAPAVQVTLKDRLRLAELLISSGRGEEAVVVYQQLLHQDGSNWDVHADLALLLLKLSKGGDGDGSKLRAAVREATVVIQGNPHHSKIKELKKLCRDAETEEAERLLNSGKFYLMPAHRRPAAARRYMHDIILKYPDSSAAKEARHLLKSDADLRALEMAQVPVVQQTPAQNPPPPPPVGVKPDPRQEKELKKEIEKREAEHREAAMKAEKLRKAEEAERQKAAEKAAKLKAAREAEELRLREKQEKERQKKLEAERKERIEQDRKRQETLRREAEKIVKERAKQESAERERIEKARRQAEEQLRKTEQDKEEAKGNGRVKLVLQDKKKQEESRRKAEEELRQIRERNAKILQNDPKLPENEQKRLKELMMQNGKQPEARP